MNVLSRKWLRNYPNLNFFAKYFFIFLLLLFFQIVCWLGSFLLILQAIAFSKFQKVLWQTPAASSYQNKSFSTSQTKTNSNLKAIFAAAREKLKEVRFRFRINMYSLDMDRLDPWLNFAWLGWYKARNLASRKDEGCGCTGRGGSEHAQIGCTCETWRVWSPTSQANGESLQSRCCWIASAK